MSAFSPDSGPRSVSEPQRLTFASSSRGASSPSSDVSQFNDSRTDFSFGIGPKRERSFALGASLGS